VHSHLNDILSREWQRGHKKIRLVGTDSLVSVAWAISQSINDETYAATRLIITESTDDAWRMREALRFFSPDLRCSILPSLEVDPYGGLDPSPKALADRMRFLWKTHQHTRKDIFIAALSDLSQKTIPFSKLEKSKFRLKLGDALPESFAETLQDWGYEREATVEDCGKFSVRGGIIDVFPPSSDKPLRIELFGDQIESLRTFSTESQRSEDEVKECQIIPAREVFYSELGADELLARLEKQKALPEASTTEREVLVRALNTRSRFPGMDFLTSVFHGSSEALTAHFSESLQIWTMNPEDCGRSLDLFAQEVTDIFKAAPTSALKLSPSEIFYTADQVTWPNDALQVEVSNLDDRMVDDDKTPHIPLTSFGMKELKLALANHGHWSQQWSHLLSERLAALKKAGLSVFLSIENQTVIRKVQSALEHEGLQCQILSESSSDWALWIQQQEKNPAWLHILPRAVPESVRIPDEKLVIIHHELLLGRSVKRKSATATERFQTSARTLSFGDLQTGDCIVHTLHGVGVYDGLKRLDIDGIENEYLQLSYRDKDKLYLPVYRLNQIQRYPGRVGTTVLDKLGGSQWEKTKTKARTGARDLAMELLSLYAKRTEVSRTPLAFDDDRFSQFESSFPFEETDDQLRAITDIEKDLLGSRPMDRLVCGDVGFGKTEVAMRAAFMAVSAGKQVAMLAPTTILVFQHLESFKKRFQGQNLEIRALNRFVSNAEAKETLKLLKSGLVHILIGTHRLLSKDIEFANLGLLVIDEEQRFGVAHKEKIRKLKFNVDTLAMSATPIPRSLNMSLMGIRDLSLINTAPVDRLPIRTYILKWNEATIRSGILSEMKRGGQIYFIHNRVQSIYSVADELRAIVPEARIRVGHGQMEDDELEKTMLAFYHKEVDVLLCTTIVESGMDVSSANTIFIDQAHTLGLSQLYQLRGRVGRSKQRAFCYLITPKNQTLEKIAQERLKVIHDNTALGSGIRIAQYDLELRGAGEILGDNQSGHINSVGYEMYMDLLNEEIEILRGGYTQTETVEPEINLRVPALIPENYIADLRVRLSYYKALSECTSEGELESIEADLKDQFGPIPEPTLNLFGVMLVRQKCKILGIKDVSAGPKNLSLIFTAQSPLKTEQIIKLATKENKKYSITPDSRLNVRMNTPGWTQALEELTLLERMV